MKTRGLAESAARLMADRRGDVVERPLDPLARERAIAAVSEAIEARAQRRARRRWMVGLTAAAATVAVGFGIAGLVHRATTHGAPAQSMAATARAAVLHVEGGGVDVVGAPEAGSRADGSPVGQGSRLVARPDGRATLAFATGTQLTLEERADVTIVSEGATQRFSLTGGAVRAHVAKLSPGERFVVATPDAEVEVRGTSFRVSIVPSDPACGDGTPTRVDVVEGTVVVRHGGGESSVPAGASWPDGCAPAVVAPSAAGSTPSAVAPRPSAANASRLAEQNDLFADGIAAKRRGANAEAIATFERFLSKYPASPLAESATVERMKLLALTDRARSRAAADDYLARYPHGYARDDAERISQGSR